MFRFILAHVLIFFSFFENVHSLQCDLNWILFNEWISVVHACRVHMNLVYWFTMKRKKENEHFIRFGWNANELNAQRKDSNPIILHWKNLLNVFGKLLYLSASRFLPATFSILLIFWHETCFDFGFKFPNFSKT